MRVFTFAATAAICVFGHSAVADGVKVGDLVIDQAIAFETAKSAKSGSGYFSVANIGVDDDRLIAVKAAFPKVMLHTTEMSEGVAHMSHVDGIDIPAGDSITLEPGGYHVMFMGLNGNPFEVGKSIPATLVFERAGEVEVVFMVEPR